jgi:four helix bundle protein
VEVWQRALAFVKRVYELTASFAGEEIFGLVSQMRRAAVSVPSNIAEGSARSSRKEFVNFLYIAQGSIAELEIQFLVSKELGFADEKALASLLAELDEISKMMIGLQKSLRRNKSVTTRHLLLVTDIC